MLYSVNFISSPWRINPHINLNKNPEGLKGTIVNWASLYSTLFCGPPTVNTTHELKKSKYSANSDHLQFRNVIARI